MIFLCPLAAKQDRLSFDHPECCIQSQGHHHDFKRIIFFCFESVLVTSNRISLFHTIIGLMLDFEQPGQEYGSHMDKTTNKHHPHGNPFCLGKKEEDTTPHYIEG
jgi:hypothetical protein